MPLDVVPKIPCQRIFVLSDPDVPRTFVLDCMLQHRAPCLLYSTTYKTERKRASYKVLTYNATLLRGKLKGKCYPSYVAFHLPLSVRVLRVALCSTRQQGLLREFV